MSFGMIRDEARREIRDGELALRRMQPGPSPFCVGKLRPPTPPAAIPTKIRARGSRMGSVRSRAMTATRTSSVATRPNGSGPDVMSTTRSASPSQNANISSRWASTSRGPHEASGA